MRFERLGVDPEPAACAAPTLQESMGDIVKLRLVRKKRARREKELRASANRLAFGRSKAERKFAEAQREKASRQLEVSRLDTGEDR